MIKITNGTSVYEVSTGAYNNIYKKLGFHPVTTSNDEGVDDDAGAAETGDEPSDSDKASGEEEDDSWSDEIEKKPISQWNKNEVKRYAMVKSIDITGTKSIDEAKSRIKDFWDSDNA